MNFVKVMIILILPCIKGKFSSSYVHIWLKLYVIPYRKNYKVQFQQQVGLRRFRQRNSWRLLYHLSSRQRWKETFPIDFGWNEIGSLPKNFKLMAMEWSLMNDNYFMLSLDLIGKFPLIMIHNKNTWTSCLNYISNF